MVEEVQKQVIRCFYVERFPCFKKSGCFRLVSKSKTLHVDASVENCNGFTNLGLPINNEKSQLVPIQILFQGARFCLVQGLVHPAELRFQIYFTKWVSCLNF